MEKQYTPEKKKEIPKTEKVNIQIAGAAEKNPEKAEIAKADEKGAEKTSESKRTGLASEEEEKGAEKKDGKKKKQETGKKKTEAVVNAKDLPISTKHSRDICNFIRGKKVEEAIRSLEEIAKFKKPLPMKGEIPHRKGKIMSGRYPINATKQFIKLLRQLVANASVNNVETEKTKIECKANKASRPYKRFGSERFKRTNVTLRLATKEEKKKQGEKK